jgi:hypothetical protein
VWRQAVKLIVTFATSKKQMPPTAKPQTHPKTCRNSRELPKWKAKTTKEKENQQDLF